MLDDVRECDQGDEVVAGERVEQRVGHEARYAVAHAGHGAGHVHQEHQVLAARHGRDVPRLRAAVVQVHALELPLHTWEEETTSYSRGFR